MRKYAKFNAFTHPHIRDKMPPAGLGTSTLTYSPRQGGRPDSRRIGRDFTRVARETRPFRWELTGPSFWPIIAAKGLIFSDPVPSRYRSGYNAPKSTYPYPRLGPRKGRRPDWRRCDWPRFPNGFPEIADQRFSIYGPLFLAPNR